MFLKRMKLSLNGRYYDSLVMTYSQRRYRHTLRKYVSQMYQNWGQIQPTQSQFICKSHKVSILVRCTRNCVQPIELQYISKRLVCQASLYQNLSQFQLVESQNIL